MKVTLKIFSIILILISIKYTPCLANETWRYKLTYQSSRLTKDLFFLITAADLNYDKKKEIIAADFGRFGNHVEWEDEMGIRNRYNLFILEWEKNGLKVKFHKQWDMTKRGDRDEYFSAWKANQMVSWQIGNKAIIETIPTYLELEWNNDKYILHEQQGIYQKSPLVGSWVFSWLSPSCYQNFQNRPTWPRECIVGIRDFTGSRNPKVVTILEEEIVKNKQYKQTLRVRKFGPRFPIEWEMLLDSKYYFGSPQGIDKLNWKAKNMFLITALYLSHSGNQLFPSFIFEPKINKNGFMLRKINKGEGTVLKGLERIPNATLYDYPDVYLTTYDLPDVYLRSTQKKGLEEYWGYNMVTRMVKHNSVERYDNTLLLRKVTLKPGLSGFVKEDISFPHHKNFLGVGYFDVEDIDNDGLDEVILVEETGKKEFYGEESIGYSNVKDYIHILKWNGKEYKAMWVSPPYTKRGTKFLVADVKNNGKKQLIVFTPYGTIQVWERQ